MARYEEGNLAYKLPLRTVTMPAPKPNFDEERRRKQARREQLIIEKRTRQQYKVMSSLRIRRVLAASALVLISALLMALPVWRNAMIIEANYANVRIQNEIHQLQRDINVREGQMLEMTDLLSIRDRAFKTLGMQTHTPDQVQLMNAPIIPAKAIESINLALRQPIETIEEYVKIYR